MAIVRPATPEDAAGIAKAHTLSWQVAYRGLVPDAYLDALRWEDRCKRWRTTIADPAQGSMVLVVTDQTQDHAVLGFAALGQPRDADLLNTGFAELYAIYVVPDRWSTGLGSLLIKVAMGAVPEHTPAMVLWVLVGNSRGRRFYERQGFEAEGATRSEDIGGRLLDEMRYVRQFGADRPSP
jgi:GNAT superfamily N-acetyltransferase